MGLFFNLSVRVKTMAEAVMLCNGLEEGLDQSSLGSCSKACGWGYFFLHLFIFFYATFFFIYVCPKITSFNAYSFDSPSFVS